MGPHSTIAGIPVYVISLADAQVRRTNMTTRLGALGIPFQFVNAIDGRTARLPDQFDGVRVDRRGFYSEPELACSLSHRLVHRMIANGSSELAMIFEDDADPQPDFPEAIRLGSKLRFDLLKFHGGAWGRRAQIGKVGNYRVMAGTPSLGSLAYLITRTAATRLCDLTVIDRPIDVLFSDLELALRVLDLEPHPVRGVSSPSEIGERGQLAFHKPRLGRFAQLALSIRKRAMFVRLYGLRAAIAMD
jgi:GR25 family glycosyltransferase involved in LPS biosynthesis